MSELPTLNKPSLPFWMAGDRAGKLAAAAHEWFLRLGQWAALPAQQLDPLTCSPVILDLLAWQRNVTPYAGEPERLYRLRVAHAYANARDAGSVAGWRRIFQRLELGGVSLEERVANQDWDIIGVVVDDARMPDQQNVLELIINEYGRTCRRYRFISRVTQAAHVTACAFGNDHSTVYAASAGIPSMVETLRVATLENDYFTVEARS
ncbi:phage tail protein [Desulfocurvibacter africanus]|uniref:phage tail protein n=1 Tax=Desulfocurvibacter africanus TaxID=873 RepID=UPI000427D7F2|nr:phage tail protein [Desulfocurvibacter africanus]